jgi:hypothetical protein
VCWPSVASRPTLPESKPGCPTSRKLNTPQSQGHGADEHQAGATAAALLRLGRGREVFVFGEAPERLRLDLPHALAREAELLADLLE